MILPIDIARQVLTGPEKPLAGAIRGGKGKLGPKAPSVVRPAVPARVESRSRRPYFFENQSRVGTVYAVETYLFV